MKTKKVEVWCLGVRPKLQVVEISEEIYNRAIEKDNTIANDLFDIIDDEDINYIGCVYDLETDKLLVECCRWRER